MNLKMANFGDERAIPTWAMYQRWPVFGFAMLFIGGILGMVFYGVLGLIAGLPLGFVVGAAIGLAMGKNKTMFPVRVKRWVKYGGGKPKFPQVYPARVAVRNFSQENAPPIEDVRIEYLEGNMIRRIPNFGAPLWTNEGGIPELEVLQVDRLVYLPIVWNNGAMVAHNVPVYYSEIVDGQPTYPKFKVELKRDFVGREYIEYVKDAEGKLIKDENGQLLKIKEESVTMFDSNKMRDLDGSVVEVPSGLAAKLNNDRAEFTQAWSIIASKYKTGGWWSKYGAAATMFLVVFGMIVIAWIFMNAVTGSFADSTNRLIAAQEKIALLNEQTALVNGQTSQALIKLGFNQSLVFTNAVNGVTPTPSKPPQLNIPFT